MFWWDRRRRKSYVSDDGKETISYVAMMAIYADAKRNVHEVGRFTFGPGRRWVMVTWDDARTVRYELK